MYKTGHYNDVSKKQMLAFMREHPFATVIGRSESFPVATQLPLEIEVLSGDIFLSGHMMRKTDHHIALGKNNSVLVLFSSLHAYVNAAWYEDTNSGSTVNYMTVQVKGAIHFTDEEGTRTAVQKITEKYVGLDGPASFKELPGSYVSAMVKAITGFEIRVESMEAVFKLSQGKSEKDIENIIAKLTARGGAGDLFIAEKMKISSEDAT